MEGMTMIVVTHEIGFARRVGSRLVFMENGHVVHDGKPNDLLAEPPSERFRDFLRHVH
jgi:glutamine transport system ATP-binding protein